MSTNPVRLAALTLVSALAVFASASSFAVLPTRTWVSGVGADANPCTRTAPCRTFAHALSQTAPGGEISALDPGDFGPVAITQPITLNGEGTLAGILVSDTGGIVVNAGANDTVIIRNLSINGAGGIGLPNGITFFNGGKLHVENVAIYGFGGQGILFEPNGASSLSVYNTTIRNSGGGIYVAPIGPSATVALNGVVIAGNNRGVRADDGANVVISGSSVVNNAGNAVVAGGAVHPVNVSIEGTSISNNSGSGILANALSTVRISNNVVTGNSTGLRVSGGSILSFGNNRVHGNATNGAPTSTVGQI